MRSWAAGPFLGFDTETTGVDVGTDRIVSAALVLRDGRRTRSRTWIVDPGVDIPPAAAAVHGISTERCRSEGRAPSLALDEIATAIVGAQRDGIPLVAYNAAFDLAILETELARHGLPTVLERLGRDCMPVIDPLVLDRALERVRPGRRTLGDLCGVYGVPDRGALHTAEVDVMATLDVLGGIITRHPAISVRSLADLHDWQVLEYRRWAEDHVRARLAAGIPDVGPPPGWPMPLDGRRTARAAAGLAG